MVLRTATRPAWLLWRVARLACCRVARSTSRNCLLTRSPNTRLSLQPPQAQAASPLLPYSAWQPHWASPPWLQLREMVWVTPAEVTALIKAVSLLFSTRSLSMSKAVTGQFHTSVLNCRAHSCMASSAPEVTELLSMRSGSLTWVEAIMALVRDQAREKADTAGTITVTTAAATLLILPIFLSSSCQSSSGSGGCCCSE